MPRLGEYIRVNDNFKNAINIYLNLNKTDKILSYIPTKSSVEILDDYINAVSSNTEQATILIGPYGKGKSHLLLVLLAILTMERNSDNNIIIDELLNKINNVDIKAVDNIKKVWEGKRPFLPVIISSSYSDLDQAFLVALNEAIKRADLTELVPDTYYSRALENIQSWKSGYKDTYERFLVELSDRRWNIQDFKLALKECRKDALSVFKDIYPVLTSGSQFNPMINADILPLFKNINEILYEEYNYGGIYIIFDEFSKFIESKDKTAAGNDMKLLQEICELAQESKNAQIFITMVAHKSIKEYGNYLSKGIINSFTGIEGRITEKLFVTSSKNNYELIQNAIIKKYDNEKDVKQIFRFVNEENARKIHTEIPFFHSGFEFKDFLNVVVRGCYPMNPVSAYMLLNISEKVAQNERTLFTFISKNEPNSMGRFIEKQTEEEAWIVEADLVYDYFKGIFKKEISNKYIHDEWLKADYAITQCGTPEQIKIVKALAVINIINKPEELPADRKVLRNAVKILFFDDVLDDMLEKEAVIYFKASTGKIAFRTNIGADLGRIIQSRRQLLRNQVNISRVLSTVSNFDFIVPKKYNQDFSMTRYFRYEFMTFESFNALMVGESLFDIAEFCDGKVIAIINLDNKDHLDEIKRKVLDFSLQKLVVLVPRKSFNMITQVQNFEVIQALKRDVEFLKENVVLQTELEVFEEDLYLELNNYLQDCYGVESGCVAVYYENHQVVEKIKYDLDQLVSNICESYYSQTPVVNNELVNRQQILTSPIKKARKNIISFVLDGIRDEVFYKGSNPEATIFRSLFEYSGILDESLDDKMKNMLSIICEFLNTCKQHRGKVKDLIEQLKRPPLGLREGVIPFYLAYGIYKQRGDVVAYLGNKEFDITADIVLNMCESKNDYYLFISTESADKEYYITELNSLFVIENNLNLHGSRLNNLLISMQRWYRALPQCTRSFKIQPDFISDKELFSSSLSVRTLLQKIDANPYEVVFDELPKALNSEGSYPKTIEKLMQVKRILEVHLELWLDELVVKTITVFDENKKEDLHHTLKKWYEAQSDISKQKVSSSRATGMMNLIKNLNIYDDREVVRRLIRVIIGLYVENWSDNTSEEYFHYLNEAKSEIEEIKDDFLSESSGQITFKNSKGQSITRCYERVTENDGNIVRNLIEEALNAYGEQLSTNAKVAILVEMLENLLD
jgi:hypothetical protein